MRARRPRVATRGFTAKRGPSPASPRSSPRWRHGRASYDWEYSTDGGKTWITAPSTLQTKTTIPGLTPGATVQFKYRAVTKTGEGDWSQPVSLLVH